MGSNWTRIVLALGVVGLLSLTTTGHEINFTDFMQVAAEEEIENSEVVLKPVLEQDIKTIGEEELLKSDPHSESKSKDDPFDNDCSNCADSCDSCCATCDSICEQQSGRGHAYAEVELMAMRAHVGEELLGKLRETYELSPRYVVGYESAHGIGARARYWSYEKKTQNLRRFGDDLLLDFDVVDLEGTTKFATKWMELLISGGFRWADIQIKVDGENSRNDMPGATFAVDFRSSLCRDCRRRWDWASVGGVRWSVMGGDWEGSSQGIIDPTRDDNIVAHEIYGGVECRRRGCRRDCFARLVFEAQNWRSDALDDNTAVGSIGFIGPRVDVGVAF